MSNGWINIIILPTFFIALKLRSLAPKTSQVVVSGWLLATKLEGKIQGKQIRIYFKLIKQIRPRQLYSLEVGLGWLTAAAAAAAAARSTTKESQVSSL